MSLPSPKIEIDWPVKRCEMHNWAMDSTRWNDFKFRDDDIVIATWAKSGTTWLQQIVGQLIFKGAEGLPVFDLAPWLDFRVRPKDEVFAMLEAQQHRRFIKTHLPVDALVFSPKAKYIYIARDGRDAVWSWYNHHSMGTQAGYDLVNSVPGRVGPPLGLPPDNVVDYFHAWLDGDGFPYWPFWSNIQSWWDIRHLPNVLLLHFNDLKADLPAEMRRVAQFLDIKIEDALWPTLIEHCQFDYMKEHASVLSPILDEVFQGGAKSFVYKGSNGRWRDVLTPEDIAKYHVHAARNLSADCAKWLATGSRGAN